MKGEGEGERKEVSIVKDPHFRKKYIKLFNKNLIVKLLIKFISTWVLKCSDLFIKAFRKCFSLLTG